MIPAPDPTVLVAAVVAVALSLFAAWLIFRDTSERRNRGRVQLVLVGMQDGQESFSEPWLVENRGVGLASTITIEARVPGHADVPARSYDGRLAGPLRGGESQPVLPVGLRWAGPVNLYRDHPTARVWEGATARAHWIDALGNEHTETIPVEVAGLSA